MLGIGDGWSFYYDDAAQFVGAEHENGSGKFSICEIVTPLSRGEDFRLFVGNTIAAALNELLIGELKEHDDCPIPDDAKVHQITDTSLIVLGVPDDLPMEFEQSPLRAISVWCQRNGVNPLCIMVPEGQTLDVLNEEDMAKHGWVRG